MMHHSSHSSHSSLRLVTLCGALLCLITACSDDNASANGDSPDMTSVTPDDMTRCVSNELLNPDTGRCEPVFGPVDLGADAAPDASTTDLDTPDVSDDMADIAVEPDEAPDEADDALPCEDVTLYVDDDGDGYGVDDASTNITVCLSPGQERAGYVRQAGDCDDNDRARNPGQIELCDDIDNNCNNELNEGITCEFFAHSRNTLYSVDPFKKTLRVEGNIDTDSALLDIDTHPNGKLYGISSNTLYVYEFKLGFWIWSQVGSLQGDLRGANGLAIDQRGDGFATARNQLYKINLATGAADPPSTLTGDVNSSGDCVISKGDVLYMTSKVSQGGATRADDLVRIDRLNNTTTVIGRTNHRNIFGLTSAWGTLFGVTDDGELIEIDINTAASTLLHTFPNVVFYGAASSPSR